MEQDMTKKHYISFAAALSSDKIQMVKLYPEGNPEARFKMDGVKKIFFYCNRDGLFSVNVNKAIDGRETAYDDIEERRQYKISDFEMIEETDFALPASLCDRNYSIRQNERRFRRYISCDFNMEKYIGEVEVDF